MTKKVYLGIWEVAAFYRREGYEKVTADKLVDARQKIRIRPAGKDKNGGYLYSPEQIEGILDRADPKLSKKPLEKLLQNSS